MSIIALSLPAYAFLYGGNPEIDFKVDRAPHDLVTGEVRIWKVRVEACGGGYTDYVLDELFDPVAGSSVTVAGGDLCNVRFYWSTAMELEGYGSLGAFVVRHEEAYTTVSVDASSISPAPLTPFELVSGEMSAGAPGLVVTIQ